jgi:hypothetical protein
MTTVAPRVRSSGPPRWLLACTCLLITLLIVGSVAPGVGGFAGKGMRFRLPLFLAPGLVVAARWWRRGGDYPTSIGAALTLPFLLDTAANAVGIYDRFVHTDDVLHFVNWFVLIAGVTSAIATSAGATGAGRWVVWTAGFGLGAAAAVFWETAEYLVMRAGVGGLTLTYGDTISDLVLSTTGGAIGAAAALAALRRRDLDP